ncbi:MAG: extracellular solute-binding protein [Spirochaetes bacterium]|nr:extracellular solute-binding protein [Spirochaetota bacterium]
MGKLIKTIKEYFGLIVIAGAFVIATVMVFMNGRVDTEVFHVVEPGETLKSIADSYQTTVARICEENYPDISPNEIIKPGMKIKMPGSAQNRIITVRLAHWQLEPGVRDGIAYMAKEYQKIHPNVRVVQNAVPESTYGQWFITQMLGGTAPDLIECALGVPYNLLIGYYMRYFTPLTDIVTQPNPYNAHNEFAKVPLRETTKDGLKTCYNNDVQEYMTIGLSQFLVRFYYNKNLLKKLTGRDTAPETWSEFLAACEKIKKHQYINRTSRTEIEKFSAKVAKAEKHLQALKTASASAGSVASAESELALRKKELSNYMLTVPMFAPIANSKYHMNMVEGSLFNVMAASAREAMDFNHDCTLGAVEQYIGFKSKMVTMDHPAYRARFKMVAQYCSNSMPGFTGLGRDDAVLMFVQQRSVFIITGTWDALTLAEQAKDNGFEIGIMDFPYPSGKDDDEDLRKQFMGASFEDPGAGFQFGTPTPESAADRRRIAIDFLLFMSAKENNYKLNELIGWIPSVSGADGAGVLQYFKPHNDGVQGGWNPGIGGESAIKWQQVYAMYQVGQMSFEKMRDDFTSYYLDRGLNDYIIVNKNWRRNIINDEKIVNMLRAKAIIATDERKKKEYWSKYRYVMLRPFTREVDVAFERALIKNAADGIIPPPPFYYSPEARARLKLK